MHPSTGDSTYGALVRTPAQDAPVEEQGAGRNRARWLRRLPPRRVWLGLLIVVGLVVVMLLARGIVLGRDRLWAHIQETGVWRVGLDPSFPPFEILDGTTQRLVGLDVDLAEAIAARWGVRVEFVGVGFDELMDAVSARRIDAAVSALPVIEHRTRDVAFSDPYIEAGTVLAVPLDSTIAGTADLAGKRVAVEWGSTGDAEARRLMRDLEGRLTPVVRESVNAALDAVLAGEADAALVDAISLALHPAADRLRTAGEPLISDPYVIVLPVGAPNLLAEVNAALAALKADGTLDRIYDRWLVAR